MNTRSKRVLQTGLFSVILLALAGCPGTVQYKTVEVPVRIACLTTEVPKPELLTPCGGDPSDEQCVRRSGKDIERLSSALDQANKLLKACQ